jgi:formylglycine-generating enzyme required for sulfatase activity
MTAVQLLFAPENVGIADKIAAGLSNSGYEALRDGVSPAQAAIVIWSAAAAASSAVIAGARAALAGRVLVPVAIGKAPPPPSFQHVWPVDLAGWSGDNDDPRWRFVLDEVELAVRRGVEFAPAPDLNSSDASQLEIDPSAQSNVRSDVFDDPDEASSELFAPTDWRASTAPLTRPRPRFPKAAILVGASLSALVGLAAGAFFIGMSQQKAFSGAAANSAPAIVAFVEPRNQPTDSAELVAAMPEFDAENFPPRPDFVDPSALAAPAPPVEDGAELTEALREGSAASVAAATTEGVPLTEDSPAEIVAETVAEPDAEPAVDERPLIVTPGGEESDQAGAALEAEFAPQAEETVIASIAEPGWSPAISDAAENVNFGNYFRECIDCPDMAEIPLGSFLFGSPEGEDARVEAEGPLTPVTLTRPFAISVREVTVADWRKCVAGGGCRTLPSGNGNDKAPVVNVDWDDAREYVVWLSRKTGSNYRLPTEAEWEFAARAGAQSPFSFGDAVSPDKANYKASEPYHGPAGADRGRPVAAGSFAPNAFGLFDMHGNVWELTADCWSADHSTASTDGAARGGRCTTRVVKGGAWSTPGSRLRAAHRSFVGQDDHRPDTGFRIVRDM